jgi:hypothetical protein
MHTNLTPPHQREAEEGNPLEYEGWDWEELSQRIQNL